MCEGDSVECDSDTPLPAAIDDLFEVKITLKDLVDLAVSWSGPVAVPSYNDKDRE